MELGWYGVLLMGYILVALGVLLLTGFHHVAGDLSFSVRLVMKNGYVWLLTWLTDH